MGCFPLSELGLVLREAREELNLSLDDIQEKTKIQKRYLQAIEEGEYDRLPGPFYSRAFIKSYAESVGLNPNDLFETYQSEVPKARPEVDALPSRSSRETIQKSMDTPWMTNMKYVAMVIVGLAIAVGVWVLAQHFVSGGSGSVAHSENKGTSYKKPKDLGNGKKPATSTDQTKPSNTTTDNTGSTDSGSSSNQAASTSNQKIELTQSKGSYYTYTLSGTDKFVIDVVADKGNSWLGVNETSASGKSYFSSTLSSTGKVQSFHQDFTGIKQIYLKVGNVVNANISINGEPLQVPKDPVFQHITIVFKTQ